MSSFTGKTNPTASSQKELQLHQILGMFVGQAQQFSTMAEESLKDGGLINVSRLTFQKAKTDLDALIVEMSDKSTFEEIKEKTQEEIQGWFAEKQSKMEQLVTIEFNFAKSIQEIYLTSQSIIDSDVEEYTDNNLNAEFQVTLLSIFTGSFHLCFQYHSSTPLPPDKYEKLANISIHFPFVVNVCNPASGMVTKSKLSLIKDYLANLVDFLKSL